MDAHHVFGHWSPVREGLVEALGILSDEQLGFAPSVEREGREALRSLGEVAVHVAGSEAGWFGHAISGELDGWPPAPAAEDHRTVASIQALLREVHDGTVAYLETIDADDLDATFALPWGPEVTRRWAIWHVLEHEIHHRGEIYLMLGLMGMEAPDV
jgi:uncharacterized damage-inducible protein DinB